MRKAIVVLVVLGLLLCACNFDDDSTKLYCQGDDTCITSTPWPTLTTDPRAPTGPDTKIDWSKEW